MKINVLTKEEGLNDENLAIVAIVTSIRSLLKFNSNLLQIIIFFFVHIRNIILSGGAFLFY